MCHSDRSIAQIQSRFCCALLIAGIVDTALTKVKSGWGADAIWPGEEKDLRIVKLPAGVTSILVEPGPNPNNENSAVWVTYQVSHCPDPGFAFFWLTVAFIYNISQAVVDPDDFRRLALAISLYSWPRGVLMLKTCSVSDLCSCCCCWCCVAIGWDLMTQDTRHRQHS